MSTRDAFQGAEENVLVEKKRKSFELSQQVIESSTKYEITDLLGEGGMGEVYKGRMNCEANIGKTVALKFIREGLSEDMYRMFLREASLTMMLEHENIINVLNLESFYKAESDKNRESKVYRRRESLGDTQEMKIIYFMVMQFIDGPDLGKLHAMHFRKKQLIPVDFIGFIISRICRALDYAHNKKDENGQFLGIVHMDISPENILINSQGVCKLTDFGIAKAFHTTSGKEDRLEVGGKPLYLSPEQLAVWQGNDVVIDRRSDLFSLGIVAYQVLTGLHPFKPRKKVTSLQEIMAHVNNIMKFKITPPNKICPGIPDTLSNIVMCALENDPNNRYESAMEMGLDLEKNFLYKDRFGPTNDSLQAYIRTFMNDFKELKDATASRKLAAQMPFMADKDTGEFNPVRQRLYFRHVVDAYKSGTNPCLEM